MTLVLLFIAITVFTSLLYECLLFDIHCNSDSGRQNSTIPEHPTTETVTVKASDLGLTVSSVAIRDEKKNDKTRKVRFSM